MHPWSAWVNFTATRYENSHQTLMFCTSAAHLKAAKLRAGVKQAVRRALEWFLEYPLWDSLWAAWAAKKKKKKEEEEKEGDERPTAVRGVVARRRRRVLG